MKKIFLLIVVILPQALKILAYRKLLKWDIQADVKIGLSYIDCDRVVLGKQVKIGHFNIITELRHFEMGEQSNLGNLNHISGRRDHPRWYGQFILGKNSRITSRHFVAAPGKVTIGDNTTIGGRDSQIWSHSLTYETGEAILNPLEVRIGADVYVGARATLVGCSIPNQAVVGAGSVVAKSFEQEEHRVLIVGNPATIKKRYLTHDQFVSH